MVVVIWHCTRHRLEAFSQFRARSKAISGVACFADPMGDGSLKPDWSAMVLTPSPKARQVPTVIRVSNSPACTLKPDWSAMVLTPSPNARQMSAKARVPSSPEGSFKADRLAMVSTPSPKARQISATELGPSTCHLQNDAIACAKTPKRKTTRTDAGTVEKGSKKRRIGQPVEI